MAKDKLLIQKGRFYRALVSRSSDNVVYVEEFGRKIASGIYDIKYRSDADGFQSVQSEVAVAIQQVIPEEELKRYVAALRQKADFVEARFKESPLVQTTPTGFQEKRRRALLENEGGLAR